MVAISQQFEAIKIERENRIAWLIMNRPEKRNAMNPTMHKEMVQALNLLAVDDETDVLVLTGAGESWCAGQDLHEYFRALEDKKLERREASLASHEWRYRLLVNFPKPTIASVNGWCFGGAFTQLICCDFAIAAEDAVFGLSEINWAIFPGGLVTKMVADILSYRDAMYYILTGDPFDGKKAAEMKLVNFAVPRDRLRDETIALCEKMKEKNPAALRAAREAYRAVVDMNVTQAEGYLSAKFAELRAKDPERGSLKAVELFVDKKVYKPGLRAYPRDAMAGVSKGR